MADVRDFERADHPLRQVASALFEGFVFVSLAPQPEPFAQAFAPLIGLRCAYATRNRSRV